MRRKTLITALAPAALLTSAVAAQQSPGQPPVADNPDLERIDQGLVDTNPLLMGRVNLGVDLRLPAGFSEVYALTPGEPGAFGTSPRFARKSGALYAVFPQSSYVSTRDGTLPVVPPGTVYYLGDLPAELSAPEAEMLPSPLDASASRIADAAAPNIPATVLPNDPTNARPPDRRPAGGDSIRPVPGRHILTDEPYRRMRIATLLDRAGDAALGRADRSD